jgi:hypothetical protein
MKCAVQRSILRGDDHSFQFGSVSTIAERIVPDGKDIGGDDHVGATTTRCACAILTLCKYNDEDIHT